MDQNQSVQFVATLVDSMVKEVTARVITNLNEDKQVLRWVHSALDNNETFWERIKNHVVSCVEHCEEINPSTLNTYITDWMSNNFKDQVDAYMDDHLVNKFDEYTSNNFDINDFFDISNYEDSIKEYAEEKFNDLQSDDLRDTVREIVNDIEFEVRVA
jgi:hypothetical protein